MKRNTTPLVFLCLLLSIPMAAQFTCRPTSCAEFIQCFSSKLYSRVIIPDGLNCNARNLPLDMRGKIIAVGNNVALFNPNSQVNHGTIFDYGEQSEVQVRRGANGMVSFNMGGTNGSFKLNDLNGALANGICHFLGEIVFDELLPVELTDFRVTAAPKDLVVSWTVAREEANEGFALDHSMDGETFTEIDRVDGRGDADGAFTYLVRVDPLTTGEHFFRLRQIDLDGTEQYMGIRSIEWAPGEASPEPFPNPARAGESLNVFTRADAEVQLISVTGRVILNRSVAEGRGEVVLPPDLQSGIYLLRVSQENGDSRTHRVRIGR